MSRNKAWSPEFIASMQHWRNKGHSVREVARIMDVSIGAVGRHTMPPPIIQIGTSPVERAIPPANMIPKTPAIYQGSIAPLSTFAKMTGRIPRHIPQLEMREETQ